MIFLAFSPLIDIKPRRPPCSDCLPLMGIKGSPGRAGDRAERALEDATHAITRAADALAKETRKQSRKADRKAVKAIKKHPVATSAIAPAAVALVGLLVAHHANGGRDQ